MPAVPNQTLRIKSCDNGISSFPGVRFSLRGTTYQNNSLITLEDIGEDGDALLCMTDLTACCQSSDTPIGIPALGDWFFPNGTSVPNMIIVYVRGGISIIWKFYRNRGPSVVRMHRREGGVDGIYRCEMPVSLGPPIVYQNIYIGLYTASTGEWYRYLLGLLCSTAVLTTCICFLMITICPN